MTDLIPVSSREKITSARQNLINDYIQNGTHKINTLSVDISGTEAIASDLSAANLTGIIGTVGVSDTLTVVISVTQDPVTKNITVITKTLTIVNGRITAIV